MPLKNPVKSKKNTPQAILVIDDELTSIKIIEHALTSAGYTVTYATSGEAGLKLARELRPDAVIIDVLMPTMDGFMLLKELKRDDVIKSKPVLVLTSRENVGDTIRRFGADSFLTKPVDPQKLVSEIERLLNH